MRGRMIYGQYMAMIEGCDVDVSERAYVRAESNKQ